MNAPTKRTRETADKDNPLVLKHYQIREDQDKALAEKASKENKSMQGIIRDLLDANGICDVKYVRV